MARASAIWFPKRIEPLGLGFDGFVGGLEAEDFVSDG
jgi:hypothetical protein